MSTEISIILSKSDVIKETYTISSPSQSPINQYILTAINNVVESTGGTSRPTLGNGLRVTLEKKMNFIELLEKALGMPKTDS